MATIKIDTFGGISPRTHPTLLADGMATVAHNCRLKSGKVEPLMQPKQVTSIGVYMEGGLDKVLNAKSMHIWRWADGVNFNFLLFPGVTWATRGNVADDEYTRLIVSGDTGMSLSGYENDTPVLYLRDGEDDDVVKNAFPIYKPAPKYAPAAQRKSGQGELGEDRRYTRFFVSWVDKYGMESSLSPASTKLDESFDPDGTGVTDPFYAGTNEDIEYNDGDIITLYFSLHGMSVYIGPDPEKVRIYKVITGAEVGRIQFVKEVDHVTGALVESVEIQVKDEDAGEIITEIESIPPDLRCIQAVPGNFYCGIAPSLPKTVCFSDIDLLYSWPIAYRYAVEDNPVALAVTGNTVFVLTNGSPYVITGTMPESMTVTKLGSPAACISTRGVCVYRNSVYFVSTEGLMVIGGSDDGTVCQNLTDKIFTKRQWQEYNPSSCIMGQHNGALHLFFTMPDGKTHKGLRIDLTEGGGTAVSTHDEIARCLCVDNATGKVYYIREGV